MPDQNAQLRLLLVEKDAVTDGDLVLVMLEEQFPRALIVVETSLEAVMVRLANERFDLVLSDLSLPDAVGAAVVHTVRSTYPETALVALTDRVDDDPALRALDTAAQECLVKGRFDGPRLADALSHAVQQRAEEEARRYLDLARGLLDAQPTSACAIDAGGAIVAINRAWRHFRDNNGGDDASCGVGVGYLDICDRAADIKSDASESVGADDAAAVGQGIRHVLAGSLDDFHHEYPCHSPTQNRWFSVRVTPVVINNSRGAVIIHVDLTDMHQTRRALAHGVLHDSLTGMPNRVLMLDRVQQGSQRADTTLLESARVGPSPRTADELAAGSHPGRALQPRAVRCHDAQSGAAQCRRK